MSEVGTYLQFESIACSANYSNQQDMKLLHQQTGDTWHKHNQRVSKFSQF